MKKILTKKGLIWACSLGLPLILAGCSINKPESPSWETTWDLPLTAKVYSVTDLIDELDTDQIVFDSLGNPSLSIRQDVDTITVGDNLTAPGISQVYRDSLGTIDIDAPIVPATDFALGELGLPIVVDSLPVDTSFVVSEDLAALSNFTWAQIDQGSVSIEIQNDLGLDIDSLVLMIFNTSDMLTPLGAAVFENGLLDGQMLTRPIDMAGKFLENQLTVRAFGVVLNQAINQPAGELVINATFPGGLTVAGAQAEIPAFNKDFDQQIALTDESVVYQATIEGASLTIQIINNTNLPMDLNLALPNFESGGVPLSFNEYAAANSTTNRLIDLAGYSFFPDGSSSPQSILIEASAAVQNSAPTQYVIDHADSIRISADMSEISFASITGQIQPTEITIDPMQQDVEFPSGFDQASLPQAELRMTLYNNSTADVFVDLQLEDETGTRNIALSDTVRGKDTPASGARATELTVGSVVLSSFLDPPPTQITITGTAIFNPNGEDSVTISQDDFFYGEVEIYSPLAFALSDTVSIDLDYNDIDIDQEDMPDFEETFIYGKISAELESHFPLGVKVSLYVSTRSDSTIFSDPDALVIGPFTLQSALTDSNGVVTEEITSEFNDSLSTAEIMIFENELLYIAPRVELLPTRAGGSVIQANDYIGITASARLRVMAGDNIWDNENGN